MIKHEDFCALGAPNDELHQLEALTLLVEMAQNTATLIEGGAQLFVEKVFKTLWGECDGFMLDLDAELDSSVKRHAKEKVTMMRMNMRRESAIFWVAAAWAIHGLRPSADEAAGRQRVQVAHRVFGMYQGMQYAREAADSLTKVSMLGADARQAQNRESRAKVFAWCDEHMHEFKSMNMAAKFVDQIPLVPCVEKTIRGWMTEWKRERTHPKPVF